MVDGGIHKVALAGIDFTDRPVGVADIIAGGELTILVGRKAVDEGIALIQSIHSPGQGTVALGRSSFHIALCDSHAEFLQHVIYGFVRDFVGTLFNAGVRVFIVHARNAWLKGLSPKENREIPPLRREVVYQLKKDFPEAIIVINGALQDLGECEAELKHVDGVMLGRAAYYTPWLLTDVDARLYNDEHAPVTRDRVIDAMEEYVRFIKPDDHSLRACCRHMHGLLTGLAGAKVWRRTLSDTALIREQGADIFRYAYGKAGWADVESFPDEDREFFS